MKNFAFCTLAYGEKYRKFSHSLISQLNEFGYHIFVLTDNVNEYTKTDLLTPIKYEKDFFSFHEKRTVVKECLKHYDTAIFLDADVYISEIRDLDIFGSIDPGLHIFGSFGDLSIHFLNGDFGKFAPGCFRNGHYGNLGLDFLKEKNLEYTQLYHNNTVEGYLTHFLEGRWILKKENGKENDFFEKWDLLASFTDNIDIELGFKNQIGAGEGSHMSIAARNSGISVYNLSPIYPFVKKYFISNYQEKVNGEKPWGAAG
jgi:hypothetical protein